MVTTAAAATGVVGSTTTKGTVVPEPKPIIAEPKMMYQLDGRSIGDIASGILELYDANRDGRISASESTRTVYRPWYGIPPLDGGAEPVGPVKDSNYYTGGYKETYSIDRLIHAADVNGDGSLSRQELQRALRRFDTGDTWGAVRMLDASNPIELPKPGGDRTAHDGILSGSEFWAFMDRLGERNISYYGGPEPVGIRGVSGPTA